MGVLLCATLFAMNANSQPVSANPTPSTPPGTEATAPAVPPTKAYIGGNFTLTKPTFATAFVLTNQGTQKEYLVRFTTGSSVIPGQSETVLVEVPPGTYRLTHWIVYNIFWGPGFFGREFKKEVEGKLTQPFEAKAGDVIFVGKFESGSQWTNMYTYSYTTGGWAAVKITQDEAKAIVLEKSPDLSAATVNCIACVP